MIVRSRRRSQSVAGTPVASARRAAVMHRGGRADLGEDAAADQVDLARHGAHGRLRDARSCRKQDMALPDSHARLRISMHSVMIDADLDPPCRSYPGTWNAAF